MDALNYHHLRYFWAVAHEGNLTRAARRLHVSQSAVSMQIQQLERELGHTLFTREGKHLSMTEAGRIALDHADAIFAVGDQLTHTLGGHTGTSRIVLRVGALATLSRNFQLDFLRPILGRKDVEMVMQSGAMADLMQALEIHRIDVLLTNTLPHRSSGSSWIAHALGDQAVGLIGHPEQGRDQRPLADILATEALLLPPPESSIRMGFDALMDGLGIHPIIAAEVDDMAMLRLLARERVGLAIAPTIVVKDEMESGLLVEVAALPDLKESFYAISLNRSFPNPLLKSLISSPAPDPQ